MRPRRASHPSPIRFPALAWACALGAAGWAALAPIQGCAALMDAAGRRLALFGVAFDLHRVDVSGLVYPSNFLDVADLGSYGLDVRLGIRAENRKPAQAVFDGAAAKLRVQDTGPSDPAAAGSIPAFSVPANGSADFQVTFPLRLNSPVFSKAVWKDILRGRDIAYAIDAELPLQFMEGTVPAEMRTVRLNLVTSEVNSKAAAGQVLDRILGLVDRFL